jgi:hypothetical protein
MIGSSILLAGRECNGGGQSDESVATCRANGGTKMRSNSVHALSTLSLVVFLAFPAAAVTAQVSDNARIMANLNELQLKVGECFLNARARIIKHGWKPIRMHSSDDYEYIGTEKELVDRKFHEAERNKRG